MVSSVVTLNMYTRCFKKSPYGLMPKDIFMFLSSQPSINCLVCLGSAAGLSACDNDKNDDDLNQRYPKRFQGQKRLNSFIGVLLHVLSLASSSNHFVFSL